jgi:hypothetical protein
MRCLLTYLGNEIEPRTRTVIVAGAQYSELVKPDALLGDRVACNFTTDDPAFS